MQKKQFLNKLKEMCKERLEIIFSKGIPDEIQKRYEKEIKYLEQSEYFSELERVLKERQENQGILLSKGTLSGSLLYFLINGKGYNPLKSYYYCSCGHYETIFEWKNCVDAPDMCCPKCGRTIQADGYSVSVESVWGLDGKKAIGFENEGTIHPVVEKRLKQLLEVFEPNSFEDLIKLSACASNVYSWEQFGDEELDLVKFKSFISSDEFKKCGFHTREELYEKLCARGISIAKAFEICEFVRKGCVVRRTSEIQKHEIPEDIVLVAKNFTYLESRAHAIQTAYQYWGIIQKKI